MSEEGAVEVADTTLLTSSGGTAEAEVDGTSRQGDDTVDGGAVDAAVSGSAEEDTVSGEQGDDSISGVPENYEEFTLPEGMQLDETALEAFLPLAKELKLTQEQAQKFVDQYSALGQKLVESQTEAFQKTLTDWKTSAGKDEEVGGAKQKEALAMASKALAKYGTDELKAVLSTTGVGNNVEIIRILARVGKDISEDNDVETSGGQGKSGSTVDRMFSKSLTAMKP